MSILTHRNLLAVAGTAALAIWLPTGASAQDRELGAGGELLEGVAAVVDEGIVLKSELSERLALVMQTLEKRQAELPPEQRPPLPPMAVIEQQVLDQLILREIQLQRADRVGITVADDMLNEALSRVAQNLGYTLEELPTVLAAQNIDYATYRDDSRRDLLVEQLEQRDVINRIAVTPRELDLCLVNADATASDTFDYNISHILIGVPANATQRDIDAARTRINEIHDRLEAGEDFARLAVGTSQAQTALEGGSLGWRKGAQLPTLVRRSRRAHEARRFLRAPPEQRRISDRQVERHARRRRAHDGRPAPRAAHPATAERDPRRRGRATKDARHSRTDRRRRRLCDHRAKPSPRIRVSSADGGELGWLSPGDTVPEFEEALAKLPLNELSQPIQSRFGWHLMEVLERRSHDTTDEAKRDQCARQIRATKAEEERELWARRLRDQAFVDIRR